MRSILLFVVCGLLLFSCTDKVQNKTTIGHFIIRGTVASRNLDGAKIYLVPAFGDNPSNVDSTIIRNGKFTFEGDTERVSIVRLGMRNRLKSQELLVVTECGHIIANIDTISNGGGTKQNIILQRWKDAQYVRYKNYVNLKNAKIKGKPDMEMFMLQHKLDESSTRIDSIVESIKKSHYNTLKDFFVHVNGWKQLHY